MNLDYNKINNLFKKNLGSNIISIHKLGGGCNSRVYKVRDAINKIYCVKIYFKSNIDLKDRLYVESTAFSTLRSLGFCSVPEVITTERTENIAVYSYIEGSKYDALPNINISQAVDFIISLQEKHIQKRFSTFNNAADASFSLNEVFTDIESRFERFKITHKNSNLSKEFLEFFNLELLPFYENEKMAATFRSNCFGIKPCTLLDCNLRILSPSDFGFHNIIFGSDGQLHFIDFEYFGWDTPEKCINDFLLHPGFTIPYHIRIKFKDLLCAKLKNDHSISFRVDNTYNLYGVKWCLIILNVFSINDLNRRIFSENTELESILSKQLEKAKKLLNLLKKRTTNGSK